MIRGGDWVEVLSNRRIDGGGIRCRVVSVIGDQVGVNIGGYGVFHFADWEVKELPDRSREERKAIKL